MGTAVVPCQYPTGACDLTVTGEHVNTGEQEACGACGACPPDGYDEWKADEFCDHQHCREAEMWRRQFEAERPHRTYRVSAEEREEIMADTELFRDEFHGRDPWV